MAWTEAQSRAIKSRGKNLLVAAAAGSGKTAVLVERIIQGVLTGDWDIDRLLVVTFTHAAAEEMAGRIEAALRARLLEERDKEICDRLDRQLVLLSGAAISTLHSFCQRLIREHFNALELDPQFRIAGEQELKLLKWDTLTELFEAKYAAGDEAFLRFADNFGGTERGDDKLYKLVLKIYDYAQSQPFPEKWLETQCDAYLNITALKDTVWFSSVLKTVALSLAAAQEESNLALEFLQECGPEAYLPVFQTDNELIAELRCLATAQDWPGLFRAFGALNFARLPTVRGMETELKEAVEYRAKNPRQRYKDILADLRDDYFSSPEEELLADLRAAEPDIRMLCGLTREFAAAFAAVKREKILVDFNDLEHFALTILSPEGEDEAGELIPSPVALELREHFQTVMVDEYQDTNGVQEAIINLLSSPQKANLFTVGDVKQSIYRFRLADPTLFLKKYVAYPAMSEKCERIDLAQNFRSRPEVLSAINFIFAQLMNSDVLEIDYDEAAALHPGPDYPLPSAEQNILGKEAELTLICREDETSDEEEDAEPISEGIEAEAQFIARRIKELLAQDTHVFDKDTKTYRPLRFRDMVILLRSLQGRSEPLLEILRQHNIPAYAAADTGYFEQPEVSLMLSLLACLDNAHQDIPLAAVMASPFGGFTRSELAQVRLAEPEGDFFAALTAAADTAAEISPELRAKAAGLLSQLSHWRRLSRELSVPELIWQLYRDTGYYDYAGGLPGGLLRQANLRMLVDRAAEYEETNFRGLFRFLRFIERMRRLDTDLAVARTLGEGEDVVRLMTIHKSKGLEFPVVFLAGLGVGFNLKNAGETVLMHAKLGLGAYRLADDAPLSYATFAWHAVSAELVRESKAEELRVLYVALTRAREKLILVGSVSSAKNLRRKITAWQKYVNCATLKLPPHAALSAVSFLDWLGLALMRHPAGNALREPGINGFSAQETDSPWEINIIDAKSLSPKESAEAREEDFLRAVAEGKKLPDSPYREEIAHIMAWRYDKQGLTNVPTKLSVTELKRRQAEKNEANIFVAPDINWVRPQFLQPGNLSNTEYGTIMHSVMQHLDLSRPLEGKGLREQIDLMVRRGILLASEAASVNLRSIEKFFRSSLGRRLLAADNYWRELPFSRLLPAKRFYEEVRDRQETLFIQGIIDLLFTEGDKGLILIDYKTDGNTEPDAIRQRYRLQICLYSEAVADILRRPVTESYLYMLQDGSIVKI